MCGICGIKSFNKLSEKKIQSMLENLKHRGPDNTDYCKFDNFYLGSTRLKIIDLFDRANMPMKYKNLSISYNGEVYNYKDLKIELINLGYTFHTNSDTEVILKLFAQYGIDSFKKLDGMFSICIYDNESNEIYLARDIFGIKPLYYYSDIEKFIFSSELQPIVKVYPELKEFSITAIKTFLLKGSVLEPMTKYKNISTVLPGQVIKVSNDFKIEKFFFDTVKNNIIESENSYEKLNEDDLFQEVQKQIRLNSNSDAEKSLMLSSGIDSLAIKLILENIKSFTLCYEKFRNTNHDEIFKLKNKLDKSVDYPLYIKNYEVENTNDNIENFTDSFSIDGSQYYLITKYIKKHNVKMAITGVGADEMFNSYPSSKFIPLFRKYNRILPNIENKINFKFNSKIERVLRLLFNCKTVSDSYLIFREIYSEKEIKNINLKNFDFSQETFSLNENISEYIKGIRSVKNQIKSLETNIYLRDQVLKDVDYASMKNSIEVRVPYLSKEILRISSNLNISENISKQFLLDRFDLKKSYKKNYKKVGFMTLNSISNMNKTKMLEYLNF
jgi:asparagine synthase (glutamine-hydrolysing)